MEITTKERNGRVFVTVKNKIDFEVTLSVFGAGLYMVKWGEDILSAGPRDYEEWCLAGPNYGKTIGRIAGRVAGAVLHYNGKDYPLKANEGRNTLHGGEDTYAFDNYRLDISSHEDDVYVDMYKVDHDSPFPGNVDLRVRYIINENSPKVRIEYKAVSDMDTPMNLTSHAYFNLAEEDIKNLTLWVNSTEVAKYDDELIPTGFRKCPECLDFSSPKALGEVLDAEELAHPRLHGIDHNWRLSSNDGVSPVLTLEGSKYALKLVTSYPNVQMYCNNWPTEYINTNGKKDFQFSCIAIEAEYEPDDYKSMTVTPSCPQRNYIEFNFERK